MATQPNNKKNNNQMIGSIIGAGAQLVGGISNAVKGRKTRKHDKQMYDKQRKDQLEDWHRANEYNSPANQMKLLKEAGINPQLAVGGNEFVSANTPSSPSMPHRTEESGIGDGIAGALSQIGHGLSIRQQAIDVEMIELKMEQMRQEMRLKEEEEKRRQAGEGRTIESHALDIETKKLTLEQQKEFTQHYPAILANQLNREADEAKIRTETLSQAIVATQSSQNMLSLFGMQKQHLQGQLSLQQSQLKSQELDRKMKQYEFDNLTPLIIEGKKIQNASQLFEAYVKRANEKIGQHQYTMKESGIFAPLISLYNKAVMATFDNQGWKDNNTDANETWQLLETGLDDIITNHK